MRAIVALNPDGSMNGWFLSMAKAKKIYNLNRDGILRSIKKGTTYKGFRWVYKEVFENHYITCNLDKLSYSRERDRDDRGYWKVGHKGVKMSSSSKARIASFSKIQSKKQANDPNCNWGKPRYRKVYCVNNNKEYTSITAAGNDLGLTQHQISVALNKHHKVKGYKFYKL